MSFSLFLKTWILIRKAFASPPVFGRRALPAGRKKGFPHAACQLCPSEHQSSQGAVACSRSQCHQLSFGVPCSPRARHSQPQQNWHFWTYHAQMLRISGVQSGMYWLKKELHFLFSTVDPQTQKPAFRFYSPLKVRVGLCSCQTTCGCERVHPHSKLCPLQVWAEDSYGF